MRFLIGGVPRSGTTILCNYFDSIDGACCFNEPHWEFARTNNCACLTNRFPQLEFAASHPLPIDPAMTKLLETHSRVAFKETFRSNYYRQVEPVVCNEDLFKAYKDAGYKVVFIIRDPIRCFESAFQTFGGPRSHWPKMVDPFLRSYLDMLDFHDAAFVKYETFLRNPREEFSKAFGFDPGDVKLKGRLSGQMGDEKALKSTAIVAPKRMTEVPLTESEIELISGSEAWQRWAQM